MNWVVFVDQEPNKLGREMYIHLLERTVEVLFAYKPALFPIECVERVCPLLNIKEQLLKLPYIQSAVLIQIKKANHKFAGAVCEMPALEGLKGLLKFSGIYLS